ncbi:hypothetical protein SUGI_0234090 [Cryptomeria japonica]|uniref:uncharacterized protein LOC131074353 n=1 Tax=Cryptomeria japonica TaxID=3369 RepID=UPI0024089671|nr:uncharacterized protein LOC131074353 [Cryptomeria japonica]GLJ14478.1 hypothetical protein SUGI_0234090 [Cryptomeria japonica]
MKKCLFIMLLVTITTFQVTSAIDFYDILPPLPSWLPDSNPCNATNCGNGTCESTKEYPFVKCVCKPGWKQPERYHNLPFQPCVVPNCTIDYSCGSASPPSYAEPPLPNLPKISEPLNPCSYNVCGAGTCTLKSNVTLEYQCNCNKGYGNIMNWTWGFCSKECELQKDCSRLNVSVSSNDSTTDTSSSNGAQGGLKFMMENSHLVTGSILATLIVLLVK